MKNIENKKKKKKNAKNVLIELMQPIFRLNWI